MAPLPKVASGKLVAPSPEKLLNSASTINPSVTKHDTPAAGQEAARSTIPESLDKSDIAEDIEYDDDFEDLADADDAHESTARDGTSVHRAVSHHLVTPRCSDCLFILPLPAHSSLSSQTTSHPSLLVAYRRNTIECINGTSSPVHNGGILCPRRCKKYLRQQGIVGGWELGVGGGGKGIVCVGKA